MTDETNGAVAVEMPQDLGASETPAQAPKPNATEQEPKPEATEQETQPSTEEPALADVSDDDDAETEGTDGQKRPSRNQRLKRKVAALADRADALEAENARLLQLAQQRAEQQRPSDNAPQPPKESDYPNDYFAYERAVNAWNAERAAEKVARTILQEQQQQRSEQAKIARRSEAAEIFRERVEEVKEQIPDFDKVVQAAKVEIRSESVLDMIRESEKGPLLAFHLASKPDRIHELNGMSELEAARHIGRLEARLSLPTPKKTTQAPPPVTPPKGGAAPAKDIRALADKDDISEYVKVRNSKSVRA